jgi:hypothetical protein
MAPEENDAQAIAALEEIQKDWRDLVLRVAQLEAERGALQEENKTLRFLLERSIEHRQKSHSELILLLTGLVSKLPINDVGLVVSKLVEHNAHVNEVCAALAGGQAGATLPQPAVLKAMDQTKRDLQAALNPAVEELIRLDTALDAEMLRSLIADPELFFSPAVVRANRCFAKGQVPRERIVREFGESALVLFQDMTTDAKLNPRPKPDEIVLAFRDDFETLLRQSPDLLRDKGADLVALHEKVHRGRGLAGPGRSQRVAFQRLTFIVELLHYYENQATEAPDVIFAQRMPALVEQLVLATPQDNLEEKAIAEAEALLAFVIHPDHRLMVINNMGKAGGSPRTLRYVLRLRAGKFADQHEVVAEFVKHLIPAGTRAAPSAHSLAPTLRLISPETLRPVLKAIMSTERLPREDAEALGRALGRELAVTGLEVEPREAVGVPPEVERQLAWEKIKGFIKQRADPAVIAGAIRDRLHAKYDADEIKESWLALTEADTMSLIRTFCALPYLPDGSTDAIAHTVMETYTSRLTHEKYASTYTKVVNSLRNMFKANPASPTLVNFLALVRWVDAPAADKLAMDVGISAPAL